MLAGRANRNNANDNTSGVVTLLEIALRLPAAQREQIAFVFFDLEEAGLIGSSSFHKAHNRAMRDKPVVNFDCVGDGDSLHLCMTKGAKKRPDLAEKLDAAFQSGADKTVTLERGFFFYPSDQMSFAVGVGVGAFHKTKWGLLYLGRVHTRRDTHLDERNIDLLAAGAVRLAETAGHTGL